MARSRVGRGGSARKSTARRVVFVVALLLLAAAFTLQMTSVHRLEQSGGIGFNSGATTASSVDGGFNPLAPPAGAAANDGDFARAAAFAASAASTKNVKNVINVDVSEHVDVEPRRAQMLSLLARIDGVLTEEEVPYWLLFGTGEIGCI
jgi:hypothetical protein